MRDTNRIRHRRQERIQQLIHENTNLDDLMRNEPLEEHSVPLEEEGPYRDTRWNDPEYVWKQQNHDRWKDERGGFHWSKSFVQRLMVAAALYALLFIMFQLHQPWAVKGKVLVVAGMSRSTINDTEISVLYHKWFKDAPSWLPAFHPDNGNQTKVDASVQPEFQKPIKGNAVVSMQTNPYNGQVMKIETNPNATVYAIAEGLVTFVGHVDGQGLTVIVQHSGGYQSEYGGLQKSSVFKNDWIKQGGVIGLDSNENGKGSLTLTLKKNGTTINPADVVNFD